MTRSKPFTFLAGLAVVPLVALAVAGCGDDNNGNATAAVTPPKTTNGRPATVGVAKTG